MPEQMIDGESQVYMDFPSALREVIGGGRITRVEWGNALEYVFLQGEWLTIKTKGEFHTFLIRDVDLLATDWIAV